MTSLNTIIPFPSQTIEVSINGSTFPITLDSGATVSYVWLNLVKDLHIPIKPNNQLAALADGLTKKCSLGEINTTVKYRGISLQLRALVLRDLHVPCFGGTTFHRDNGIIANLLSGSIIFNSDTPNPVTVNVHKTSSENISCYRLSETKPETRNALVQATESPLLVEPLEPPAPLSHVNEENSNIV